jgi:hypothetical protein
LPEIFSDFTIPESVTVVAVELLIEDSSVEVVGAVLMERCEAGVTLKVQVVGFGIFTFGERWCGVLS